MQILFIRHGESTDDVDNQYGGWSDFHLTAKGRTQIEKRARVVEKLNLPFERIFVSPLVRAQESGRIIAKTLGIKMETLELVKERNKYGILSGLEKGYAEIKYPDQVQLLASDGFVLGSERLPDFIKRVKRSVDYLLKTGLSSVVVVSHGNYMRYLAKEIFGEEIVSFGDGGFILTELAKAKSKIVSKDLT